MDYATQFMLWYLAERFGMSYICRVGKDFLMANRSGRVRVYTYEVLKEIVFPLD